MAMNLREFNEQCRLSVQEDFSGLGLKITNFTIENINFPPEIEKAIDQRSTLGILGDKMGTYTQKAAADALKDAAKNPGAAGMFVGMGVGGNAGGYMGQTMGGAFAQAKDKPEAPPAERNSARAAEPSFRERLNSAPIAAQSRKARFVPTADSP